MSTLRIGLILLMQETDTFNPVPTTLSDFTSFGLLEGDDVLRHVDATGPIAGYLDAVAASEENVETVPIIRANAQSGGRLTRSTLDDLCARITTRLSDAGPLDGLMVMLHGAACAEGIDDLEGHVLREIRSVVGATPVALMLDHHANVTQEMMELSDLVMGFRTQPHDPFETGRDLTRIALSHWRGRCTPTKAWRKIPLITHQEQFLTSSGPMKTWFDAAREIEKQPRVLTASTFPMQPWLDVEQGGWTAMVFTDGDQPLAERLADELAQTAWNLRHEFMKLENVPPDDAVRSADASGERTVLLSDTGDSVLGGSTGDSTVILSAVLRVTPKHRALIPVTDPTASVALAALPVGSVHELRVGGWSSSFFEPVAVKGTVRAVSRGYVDLPGLPQGGVDAGTVVAFDIGVAMLLVSERPGVGGIHPDAYRHLGIEPADYKMVVVKTASNFQYMRQISTRFLRVATPGPTQSDVASLPWSRLPRPIFPLDDVKNWRS
ncbi:MAG: M81 family peptidase [Acidimicrobiia bacterium]|nr:M81 family peptidase [Acidimicrobiia bacterium]